MREPHVVGSDSVAMLSLTHDRHAVQRPGTACALQLAPRCDSAPCWSSYNRMFNPSRPAPTSLAARERGLEPRRVGDVTPIPASSCVERRGTRKNPSAMRGANASRGRASGSCGPASARSGAARPTRLRRLDARPYRRVDSTSMCARIVFNSATSACARSSVTASRASAAMCRTSSSVTAISRPRARGLPAR